MSATNSAIQYPDFDPCIQQEANGERNENSIYRDF